MSRLRRDGTAESVSRNHILRRERGQGNIHFPCSADHEQDWEPYPVDPYSCFMCDHTYMYVCVCVCVCVYVQAAHPYLHPSVATFKHIYLYHSSSARRGMIGLFYVQVQRALPSSKGMETSCFLGGRVIVTIVYQDSIGGYIPASLFIVPVPTHFFFTDEGIFRVDPLFFFFFPSRYW